MSQGRSRMLSFFFSSLIRLLTDCCCCCFSMLLLLLQYYCVSKPLRSVFWVYRTFFFSLAAAAAAHSSLGFRLKLFRIFWFARAFLCPHLDVLWPRAFISLQVCVLSTRSFFFRSRRVSPISFASFGSTCGGFCLRFVVSFL